MLARSQLQHMAWPVSDGTLTRCVKIVMLFSVLDSKEACEDLVKSPIYLVRQLRFMLGSAPITKALDESQI